MLFNISKPMPKLLGAKLSWKIREDARFCLSTEFPGHTFENDKNDKVFKKMFFQRRRNSVIVSRAPSRLVKSRPNYILLPNVSCVPQSNSNMYVHYKYIYFVLKSTSLVVIVSALLSFNSECKEFFNLKIFINLY